jgi:hypothetical protein
MLGRRERESAIQRKVVTREVIRAPRSCSIALH